VIVYALFAPIILEIDSRSYLYQFRIVPIFRIWWASDNLFGHPEMSIFGIRKKLTFLDFNKNAEESKTKKISKSKFRFFRFISLIKSFRVRTFYVDIDTGNMPLNGKLYPIMFLLSRITGKSFNINFIGKTEVVIALRNNAFRLLKAYIKNKSIK
jgi:hypothetical protein